MEKVTSNLFLTGFMGSGKSSVGKELSLRLSRCYFDLDQVIEDYVGLSVDKIIEKFGFEYFRKIENQKLAYLCTQKESVISLGGGSLINTSNQNQVKKSGILIYLMASENILIQRLEKSYKRPLMRVLQKEGYQKLFSERVKGYLNADLILNTDQMTINKVCESILEDLKFEK